MEYVECVQLLVSSRSKYRLEMSKVSPEIRVPGNTDLSLWRLVMEFMYDGHTQLLVSFRSKCRLEISKVHPEYPKVFHGGAK